MDTKIEILNDHYKDTHLHILQHGKVRDRMIIFTGMILFLLCFQIFEPHYMLSTVNNFIQRNVEPDNDHYYLITELDSDRSYKHNGAEISVDDKIIGKPSAAIGFMLWVLLLSMCIKYCYSDLHLTRLYKYIELVENKIHKLEFNDEKYIFQRENVSRLIFKKNWAGKSLSVIHHAVFVLLILAVSIWKIQDENIHHVAKDKIFTYLDWVIFVFLIFTLLFHNVLKRKIVNDNLPLNKLPQTEKVKTQDRVESR
ncbi:MAG: hypothetical protein IAE93_09385 [Ignavibacteria bacterium]|nr:hypothetical protein [Ignavibacteria bacterium]